MQMRHFAAGSRWDFRRAVRVVAASPAVDKAVGAVVNQAIGAVVNPRMISWATVQIVLRTDLFVSYVRRRFHAY